MAVLSMVMCNQTHPSLRVRPCTLDLSSLHHSHKKPKDKAVVILGTTGTGKSKLSLDLATQFNGEIISLDKMQVYRGFDIMTNKITEEERRGVPHHLLDIVHSPIGDFTSTDFCNMAHVALESIVERQRLPIIVGCTNSYMEALVDDKVHGFRHKYDCCYLWIDVSLSVLCQVLAERVDQMVEKGVVEEARQMFNANGRDYSKGVLKTIGGAEFERYFRVKAYVDEETRARLMQEALSEMKTNSCKLAHRQLGKILRLKNDKGLNIHRIDATNVYQKKGKKSEETWNELVLGPSMAIVTQFLNICVPN